MSKVRRGQVSFDVEQLASDVVKAWHEYDEAKLAKMWEYHNYCLKAAIDYHGGNNYPRHRPAEAKAAAIEPPKKRQRTGSAPLDVVRRI